jgi:predicted membrane-bound mannosyltransferase
MKCKTIVVKIDFFYKPPFSMAAVLRISYLVIILQVIINFKRLLKNDMENAGMMFFAIDVVYSW